MFTQHYEMTVEFPEDLEKGQMIVKENTLIGFIYDVNPYNKVAEIILFESMDIPMGDNMTFIESQINEEEVMKMFEEMLVNCSVPIQEEWKRTLKIS